MGTKNQLVSGFGVTIKRAFRGIITDSVNAVHEPNTKLNRTI
jgi:hypothetical protein